MADAGVKEVHEHQEVEEDSGMLKFINKGPNPSITSFIELASEELKQEKIRKELEKDAA